MSVFNIDQHAFNNIYEMKFDTDLRYLPTYLPN